MDSLTHFRQKIQKILSEFADKWQHSANTLKVITLFDKEQDHYQVLQMGWEKGQFVFSCMIHIDIIDERIWIQRNTTDTELIPLFVAEGISPSCFAIGFIPVNMQYIH